MLFLILFRFSSSFSGEGLSIDPIKPPFPEEIYQSEQFNSSIPGQINVTLMIEIKEKMFEINETIKSLINGSKNINESLEYLSEQVESLSSSIDINLINETLIQFERLLNNYSNEVDKLITNIINKFFNEKLVSQEILVNYVPRRYPIRRSQIRPITEPPTQKIQDSNFTFETLRPHTAKSIYFDNYTGFENSLVVEANLHFFLKGRLTYSHLKCFITNNSQAYFQFSSPVLFDKFIIQCLKNNGHEHLYTLPTFHLLEPKRIRY